MQGVCGTFASDDTEHSRAACSALTVLSSLREHACWIMNAQRSAGGFSLIPGQSGTDRSEPAQWALRVSSGYSSLFSCATIWLPSCLCFPPPNRNRAKRCPGGQNLPLKALSWTINTNTLSRTIWLGNNALLQIVWLEEMCYAKGI